MTRMVATQEQEYALFPLYRNMRPFIAQVTPQQDVKVYLWTRS